MEISKAGKNIVFPFGIVRIYFNMTAGITGNTVVSLESPASLVWNMSLDSLVLLGSSSRGRSDAPARKKKFPCWFTLHGLASISGFIGFGISNAHCHHLAPKIWDR